jgi:hypothetical protein
MLARQQLAAPPSVLRMAMRSAFQYVKLEGGDPALPRAVVPLPLPASPPFTQVASDRATRIFIIESLSAICLAFHLTNKVIKCHFLRDSLGCRRELTAWHARTRGPGLHVVGLDLEWRSNSRKGVKIRPTAIIQVMIMSLV